MKFNKEDYIKIAQKIFNFDSPSGYTKGIVQEIQSLLKSYGYASTITNKGTLKVFIKGKNSSKKIAIASHVDTLGMMVRSIKDNGSLSLTKIGSPSTPTLDGEYVRVVTREGKIYEGTILSTSSSVHVYEDAEKLPRDVDHLEVRLDEKVNNAQDVVNLGIQNGDYVFINPKFEYTKSEFIKSRFIDDKGCVCILLTFLKNLEMHPLKYDTTFYFTVYEEIGHGASSLDPMDEFLVLDMGCVGKDLKGNEYAVSICAKDSSGPYDYDFTTQIINLAKEKHINYVVDIFPYYSSDIRTARDAGLDFKGALIGPGVHASHGMERTHIEAIMNTYQLLCAYILED